MKLMRINIAIACILFSSILCSQTVIIQHGSKVKKKPEVEIAVVPEQITNESDGGEDVQFVGDRLIFFVHGLGGDDFSWDQAAAYMGNEYKVVSLMNTLDYSSNSLNNAGQVLQNTIDGLSAVHSPISEVEDPGNTNFIVAHSQGGLVSRAAYKRYVDLDKIDERTFGGIVTFGTPHQGAQILNNVPDFLSFIDNSCSVLLAGPVLEGVNSNFLLAFLIDPSTVEEAINSICGVFANDLVPFIMADYLDPITNDYKVGSVYLNGLNTFDENMEGNADVSIPKVAYYGVEEDPIVWRTIYSLLNDVNEEPVFMANDDDDFIEIANSNQDAYYAKYLTFKGYIESDPMWPFSILDDAYEDLMDYYETMNAYEEGYQWWLNVDMTYLSLIGAVEYYIESCHCDCEETNVNGTIYYSQFDIDCDESCNDIANDFQTDPYSLFNCYHATVLGTFIKPNDGVVLVESAKDYPGADNDEDNIMYNTNHMQMRNNSETQAKLIQLTSGNDGLFFKTDTR